MRLFRSLGRAPRPETSLPRPEDAVRLVAMGDSKPPVQAEAFALAAALEPEAVIFTGDAAYAGSSDRRRDGMLRAWRRDWGPLWSRLYAVAGNHDLDSPRGLDLWRRHVPLRHPAPPDAEGLGFLLHLWPVTVVGLDASRGHIDRGQREWAAECLAASDAPHRIAVFHEPAFPDGFHRGRALDALPGERDRLWSMLEQGGVRLVLNGHEHAYSRRVIARQAPVHQIITGGAGGILYHDHGDAYTVFRSAHHVVVIDADEAVLAVTALALDGEVIERLEIPAPTATAPGSPGEDTNRPVASAARPPRAHDPGGASR